MRTINHFISGSQNKEEVLISRVYWSSHPVADLDVTKRAHDPQWPLVTTVCKDGEAGSGGVGPSPDWAT